MIHTMMTSRERVRAALNHQPTDRVPVDLGATRVTGIAATAYARLLRDMGLTDEVRVYDVKQQLAQPSPHIVDALGGDCLQITRLGPTTGMPFLRTDRWKPGATPEGEACLVPASCTPVVAADGALEIHHDGRLCARRTPASPYFDVCTRPLADATTVADIDRFVWPDAWSAEEEVWLRERVARLHATGKALVADLPAMSSSFFEIGHVLFGYERYLELLATEPELMAHFLDVKLAHDLAILDRFLGVVGPFVEVVTMYDDLGAQDRLQISPTLYRRLLKPRQAAWIAKAKSLTRAKVFLHCDGAIAPIIPDLIDIGLDILNPLQTSAKGMDPAWLKQEYGTRLSFWGGGVETQTTLPFGTCDDIRREVASRRELLGAGGGYVFATVHNIQPDITPDRIRAVFGDGMSTDVPKATDRIPDAGSPSRILTATQP